MDCFFVLPSSTLTLHHFLKVRITPCFSENWAEVPMRGQFFNEPRMAGGDWAIGGTPRLVTSFYVTVQYEHHLLWNVEWPVMIGQV